MFSLSRNINRIPLGVRTVTKNAFGSPLPGILEAGGWESAWKKGITPWDAKVTSPLVNYLYDMGMVPKGDVLVPGAGSARDAIGFALKGARVTAIDISPSALAVAKNICNSDPKTSQLLANGSIKLVEADFFKFGGKFECIFDNAFFCSFEEKNRDRWAASMSRLLSPTGVLAISIFPMGNHEGGPPFAVSPDIVEKALLPYGWECLNVIPVPDSVSLPARANREALGLYRRVKSKYPMINTPVQKIHFAPRELI